MRLKNNSNLTVEETMHYLSLDLLDSFDYNKLADAVEKAITDGWAEHHEEGYNDAIRDRMQNYDEDVDHFPPPNS